MHKFGTWLHAWMLSSKREINKQTFSSCHQTSKSFPLLIQPLLETKGLDFILTENIQSDLLEKRFGRYRQLIGANYFSSEKQTLDAEKSIRFKSLITFSRYTKKEVSNIMRIDSVKSQAEAEHCRNITTQMLLPRPDDAHMTEMDEHIVY